MRKILIFLLSVLLSSQFALAQRTLYILSNDNVLYSYKPEKLSFTRGSSDSGITIMDIYDRQNNVESFQVSTINYCMVTMPKFSYKKTISYSVEDLFAHSFNVFFYFNITSLHFLDERIKDFSQIPVEYGICYTNANSAPTILNRKISVTRTKSCIKDLAEEGVGLKIDSLASNTKYFYRAYVKIFDQVIYGNVGTAKTLTDKSSGKFVDLGLPSGILWAKQDINSVPYPEPGYELPTIADFQELVKYCEYAGRVYVEPNVRADKYTSTINGNSIYFGPVTGYKIYVSATNVDTGDCNYYYWLADSSSHVIRMRPQGNGEFDVVRIGGITAYMLSEGLHTKASLHLIKHP